MALNSQSRFIEAIHGILYKKLKAVNTDTEQSYITGASIIVKDDLHMIEIQRLITMATIWNFKDIAITASGKNVKVTFSDHQPLEEFPTQN